MRLETLEKKREIKAKALLQHGQETKSTVGSERKRETCKRPRDRQKPEAHREDRPKRNQRERHLCHTPREGKIKSDSHSASWI